MKAKKAKSGGKISSKSDALTKGHRGAKGALDEKQLTGVTGGDKSTPKFLKT